MTTVEGRELTYHEIKLLVEYVDRGDRIDALEEERVKLRDQLAASLGTDVGLIAGNVAVTVTRTHPSRLDAKRLKAEHATLYETYLKPAENESVTLRPRRDVIGVLPRE